MVEERPPIVVKDEYEVWVVYAGDNAYDYVASLPQDGEGIRHTSSSVLAKVAGWWWDKAEIRVQEFLDKLEIPWDDISLSEEEAREGEPGLLVERLARVSFYITRASREMVRLDSKLSLTKSALEQAVSKLIAIREDKGTIAAKTALLIS